jgi:cell wall-associated NlpC family hydrolase
MSTSSESANILLQQVQAHERRARRTALLLTLIPLVVAIVLIWVSVSQLSQMNEQLQAKKDDLADANTQLTNTQVQAKVYQDQLIKTQASLVQAQKDQDALKSQQADTSKHLSDLQNQYDSLKQEFDDLINSARSLRSSAYQRDPLQALKLTADQYPRQSELVSDMLQNQKNVPWKLDGISPQEGFDSAGLAAYMLQKYKLISQPASDARSVLPKLLKQESQPRVGDVVFYELGYTMFYYLDERGDPFVVGMTPLGILALKPDFAKVLSYGQVNYPQ